MVGIMKFSFCHGNLRGTDPWHTHGTPTKKEGLITAWLTTIVPWPGQVFLKVLLLKLRYFFVGFISKAADFWHWLHDKQRPLDSTKCSAALPPGIVFGKVTKWRLLSFWNPQVKANEESIDIIKSYISLYAYNKYMAYIYMSHIFV